MTTITDTIEDLLTNLVKKIVDNPKDINIQVACTTKSILVQIKCNENDRGKIIGRQGRIIDSLKIISTAVKNTQFLGDKKDIFIEILEEEKTVYKKDSK